MGKKSTYVGGSTLIKTRTVWFTFGKKNAEAKKKLEIKYNRHGFKAKRKIKEREIRISKLRNQIKSLIARKFPKKY